MSIQTQIDRLRQNISAAFAAVGQLGGTLPASEVSGNLASAIQTIPIGSTKKEKSGTFTTNSSAKATVNCGFKPDYVVIMNPRINEASYMISVTAHFTYNPDNRGTFALLLPERTNGIYANSFDVTQTSTGFSVLAENINWSLGYSNATNTSFKYYAVKYE